MTHVVKTEYLKTKDVADRVQIAQSTVRKYCQELEKQGFVFKKDGDTRLFVSADIELFKGIDSMRKIEKASLHHAVTVVLTHHRTAVAVENGVVPTSNELMSNDIPQVVAQILKGMEEKIEALTKKNDDLEKQIAQGFHQVQSQMTEFKEEVIQSRLITHAKTEEHWLERLVNWVKPKQKG